MAPSSRVDSFVEVSRRRIRLDLSGEASEATMDALLDELDSLWLEMTDEERAEADRRAIEDVG